ncbi:MAG: autotransporter domain-containing protein, partial [Phycisphaeraceae bacterium]|nr:autotransporter domain-containing protein [Phycisphaeraceae bacterium]
LTMAGAQLDMSGVTLTIDSLTGVAGTIVDTIGNKLTIDGSSTTEFAGVITNLSAGQLILDAAHSGQLTLSGANTYNGATTLSGGTLVIANTGSVDGNVVVDGGTFVIGSDTAIDDADSLIINSGNLQSDNDSRNLSSGVDVSVNGDFAVTGTNDLQLSGNVDLNASTRTLTTTDAANTTTLSGIISSGGITKAGAGELLLTGANTYANETTLNAGTLTLGNNTALGSGALRINAGTLASNNNLRMLANAVSVYGDFAVGGSNNLALTGSVNLSGGDADHTATISNNTTLAGNLTGGDLTKAGAGALTLTGTNSFATGLTITAGTLNIDSLNALSAADNLIINGGLVDVNAATLVAGLSGTGGTLNVDATLAFGDANNKSLASTITGASAIQKIGTGTQTLTGDNNSFSGGFTVYLGTLAVGHTNALGNSMTSGVILNGGTLASALDNVTVANNIGLTANSNIEADTNMDMIQSGIISGGFAVNKTGAGTLQLEGANTFNTLNLTAGNVVLNNGASNALSDTSAVDITGSTSTLQLNHNETIGSLAGVAGSTVNLQSNTLTTGDATALTNFAGALTGTGGLTKMGTGNFLLSGTNTFTGDVNLNAGLLTLSGGSALADAVKVMQTAGTTLALINNETIGALAGDGSVALGANTLGIGGSIDTTYAGIISGAGGLNYNSTGILTLSNINTFTGDTNINSGTLNLAGNNVLAGDVNVNGGSLTGIGNIGGNLNIFSGMLSPGNSAGIINVAGNFSLASAATYLAEIDYAGTGNATTVDMLAATGSITLANGSILQVTLADVDDEAVEGDKHILATGSSIIDNGLTIDEPALIDLSYTTMGGTLEITIVNLLNFEEATANSVNPAIGTALVAVAAAADNNNADAQALLDTLDNLTETQLNAFVEQVNNSANGSSLGSQTITQLVQTFNQVLAGHLASRRSNLPVYAQQGTGSQLTMLAGLTDDPHTLAQVAANEQNSQQKNEEVRMAMPINEWAAFGKIYGILSDQDTTSNRTGYSANGVGVQFGMDYQINENWLVGLAFDYAKTDVTLDSGLGSIDVDSFRIGPFASYFNDNWYVDLNLTYGLHNNDAVRNVIATGAVDATYDAYDISMYIGGGYQFKLNEAWTLTPTGSLRYTYYNREAYSETGTGALTYGEYDTSTLHSRLGAKLTYQMQTTEILFIPEVVLGWEHEYLDDNDAVSAAFVSGGAFTVSSGNPDQNSIFFGAGLTAIIEEQWTTFVRYEGNVSDNGGTHSITGGVRFDF